LHTALLRRRQAISKGAPKGIRECKAILRATRERIQQWPSGKLGRKELCVGIQRTYRQGAKAFHRVETEALPESLHEWRKRTKDLWQQLRILKPIHPQALGALSSQMKRLTEYLGEAHDLTLLEAAAGTTLKSEERELIERPIRIRRVKLQRAALELGQRIYAQKPGAFVRPIKKHAKAWLRRHRLRLRNQVANDD
jgi:CHAD domain-containing protein